MSTSIFDNRKYGGSQTIEEHRKQKHIDKEKSGVENIRNQERNKGERNKVGMEDVYGKTEHLGPEDDTRTSPAILKKLVRKTKTQKLVKQYSHRKGFSKDKN